MLEKEDIRTIIDSDFVLNPDAFTAGRRNDDVVDSMVMCFALDEPWKEYVWERHCDKVTGKDEVYYQRYVRDHVERVEDWLYDKENLYGYNRGETDVTAYCINY